MVLLLNIDILSIANADKTGKLIFVLCIKNKSIIMAIVEVNDTSINVLSPAECLLLALSQPIIEESETATAIRKATDKRLISAARYTVLLILSINELIISYPLSFIYHVRISIAIILLLRSLCKCGFFL